MKNILAILVILLLFVPSADAGWFSRGKTSSSQSRVSAEPSPKTVEEPVDWSTLKDADEIMARSVRFNKNKIGNVHPGMTREEVRAIMGEAVLIGYQAMNADDGTYENIFLKNPYRAELLEGVNKSYEAFFYVTDVTSPDGKISDSELTPVVFEENRLIGKDWAFYDKLKAQLAARR